MAFSLGGGSTEETRLLWRLAGMGFQFGTEIIAGILLGWVVDRTFGTAPKGVVIGAIAGILVAMSHFIRQAMRLNREMDRVSPVRKPLRTPPEGEGDAIGSNRGLPPRGYDGEKETEEEELTHEQWKALRDRELEPDNPSQPPGDER